MVTLFHILMLSHTTVLRVDILWSLDTQPVGIRSTCSELEDQVYPCIFKAYLNLQDLLNVLQGKPGLVASPFHPQPEQYFTALYSSTVAGWIAINWSWEAGLEVHLMLPIAQKKVVSKTISVFVGKIVTTFIKVKYLIKFCVILVDSTDILKRRR